MRVGLISFLYDQGHGGGASAVVESLAAGLQQYGHDVFVVTSGKQTQVSREVVDGIRVYRVPPANLYWVAEKDEQATWRKLFWQLRDTGNPTVRRHVQAILQSERPDVVNVHKLRGLSPLVWSAAKRARIPALVQTCHDYELMSPEGTLVGRIGKWSSRQLSPLMPYQKLRAYWSHMVDCVTCPSRYTLDKLVACGFFPHAEQQIIRNAHGFSNTAVIAQNGRTHGAVSDRQQDILRLLYLGRLEQNKGIEWLCSIVTEYAHRLPNVRLDVAGWGMLETHLRSQYGNDERIIFHGVVAGEAKIQQIQQADALVVPSVYEEISPVVISEAYACGKPVIATTMGGLPELVRPGETGWLVRPFDSVGLGETLATIAASPQLAHDMSAACIRESRHFTQEAMVTGYLNAYRSTLERTSAAPSIRRV